jgi:phosphate transport system substrate-binding protein
MKTSLTLVALTLAFSISGAFASEISVAGSTTVQPLAELLAEGFESIHSGVRINVQGGGSSVGVKSAGNGTCDIGMASREVKDSEFEENPGIVVHTIARDGIAVACYPGSGVADLSLEEVRGIFDGTITNWSEVGGSNATIIVISREEGSGTRGAFEEMVMGDALITLDAILQPSNGACRTTCSTTPNSITYLSFGFLDDTTQPISIDGAAPTPANAANGSYPVVRPLNMITMGSPSGDVSDWLDFILSADGQAIVTGEGYLPVN